MSEGGWVRSGRGVGPVDHTSIRVRDEDTLRYPFWPVLCLDDEGREVQCLDWIDGVLTPMDFDSGWGEFSLSTVQRFAGRIVADFPDRGVDRQRDYEMQCLDWRDRLIFEGDLPVMKRIWSRMVSGRGVIAEYATTPLAIVDEEG